jgi:SSS family solute:Na+ symporter
MGPLDAAVIAAFLAATVALGLRRRARGAGRTEEYLLAGRSLGLASFVVTLVATWYGGVLGVGEYAYRHGISNWLVLGAPYYVGAALFAVLLAERARRFAGYTVPDILYERYGRAAGWIGAATVFALSVPAPYLLMLGVLLRRTTGMGEPLGVTVSAIFCASYVAARGFRSVVQTKGLQFALMYGGFLLLLPVAVANSGGWLFLRESLPEEAFEPLGGRSLSYVLAWYVIALQTLVEPTFFQRCFAARSPAIARRGIFLALVFFALFDGLATFTGMYARALVPDLPSAVDAYPALAEKLLPSPLLGVFYAGLFATILSTVDSFLFVGAATIGRDFVWRSAGGKADQVRWTHAGLLLSAAAGTAVALGSESVVNLWYGFGSAGTAILLLPLLGAFYPTLTPDRRFAAIGMAASGSVTLGWLLLGLARAPGSAFLGIEPIYPGLLVGAAIHGAGVFYRRSGKTRERPGPS